jgi:hypothetical protein
MQSDSQPGGAQQESRPGVRRVVRQLNYALGAVVAEAAWLYRVGGLLGIMFGVSAVVLSNQIRRMGLDMRL